MDFSSLLRIHSPGSNIKEDLQIHPTLFDLPFQARFFFLPAQTKGRRVLALFSPLPFMSAFLFYHACPGRSAAHKHRMNASGPPYGATGVAAEMEHMEEHGYRGSAAHVRHFAFVLASRNVISGFSGSSSTSHTARTG